MVSLHSLPYAENRFTTNNDICVAFVVVLLDGRESHVVKEMDKSTVGGRPLEEGRLEEPEGLLLEKGGQMNDRRVETGRRPFWLGRLIRAFNLSVLPSTHFLSTICVWCANSPT